MNRTKIEYVDYTWNPVTGCLHGCNYCYARKIAMRFQGNFKPTYHPNRLREPLKIKKPSRILICSMSDLFGEWVYKHWIDNIIDITRKCSQHTFLFLTKNPKNYRHFDFPDNCWIGTTITTFEDRWRGAELAKLHSKYKTFVSLEPLLDNTVSDYVMLADWIIVGILTGTKGFIPYRKTIRDILERAKNVSIPVFLKNNLLQKYIGLPKRQEIPL